MVGGQHAWIQRCVRSGGGEAAGGSLGWHFGGGGSFRMNTWINWHWVGLLVCDRVAWGGVKLSMTEDTGERRRGMFGW